MSQLFNNVFTNDAFSFASLTEAVNDTPFVESRLGDLGLFSATSEGVETDTVIIDFTEGQLQILTSRERGADPERANKDPKAKSKAITIPHFQFEDRVMAASLLGKRKPGTNTLETVASKIMDRYDYMLNNVYAPTMEIHRLNALRGILLDSDGSVIHNFFDFCEESQVSSTFVFSSATFDVRGHCHKVQRLIEDYLGGVPYNGIRAICGRDFFDNLVKHPSVRDTYLNWEAAQELRNNVRKEGFPFGGIIFEEYRGIRGLTGGMGHVPDGECLIFPEGVAGMFRTYFAPANFLESVNELGIPLYAKVAPDWKYNRWVDTLMETNPLHINTRPQAVIKGDQG